MSEEEAFVAALRAAPDDDTTRLVFADFLDERGEHDRAAWLRDPHVAKWMPPDYRSPVPALLAAFDATDGNGSSQYYHLLDEFRRAGAGCAPDLRAALADESERRREIVADAFGYLPDGVPRPLPELLDAVQSPDTHVTRVAVIELGWHGPAAAPALPLLEATWHRLDPLDQDWEYRRGYCAEIARTFGRIGAAAARAAPLLMPLLDEDRSSIDAGHDNLRAIGPAAAPVMWAHWDRSQPGSFWNVRVLAELAEDPLEYLLPLLRGETGRAADRVTAAETLAEWRWDGAVSAAVPELVAALQAEDNRLRVATAKALGRIAEHAADAVPALEAALADADGDVRLAAADALTCFVGPQTGYDAFEALLADPIMRTSASRALMQRLNESPAALATLVRLLRHPNPDVRAAVVAEGLPPYSTLDFAEVDFAALGEAMADPLPEVRRMAAHLAYNADDAREPLVPALLAALGEQDQEARTYIGYALAGGATGHSSEVLAGLLAAFRGPNPLAMIHAAELLAERDDLLPGIGEEVSRMVRLARGSKRGALLPLLVKARPLAPGTLDLIREMLRDRFRESRLAALRAVETLGPLAADTLPDLLPLLGTDDEEGNLLRAALVKVGGAAREPLVPFLTDTRVNAQFVATYVLSEIGPPAAAGAALVALAAEDFGERWYAITALGRLPDPAAPPPGAVDALRRALADANPQIVRAAVRALGHFGPAAGAAFEDILQLTYHENVPIRTAAVEVLARFGRPPSAVVPRLWGLLTTDESVRSAVAVAACDLGPDAAPLAAELEASLTDDDGRVNAEFALALRAIGPPAAPSAPQLRALMAADGDEENRYYAALALVRVEPGAADALAVLRAMLADPEVSDEYRVAAAEAVLEVEPVAADALAVLRQRA